MKFLKDGLTAHHFVLFFGFFLIPIVCHFCFPKYLPQSHLCFCFSCYFVFSSFLLYFFFSYNSLFFLHLQFTLSFPLFFIIHSFFPFSHLIFLFPHLYLQFTFFITFLLYIPTKHFILFHLEIFLFPP